jgi:putative transposase
MSTSGECGERPSLSVRTLRFKVRAEANTWLDAAAIESNQAWNYFNATSYKAARPYFGKPHWLTGYDLCNLSAGATEFFDHIGADTIQRIATEFATRRMDIKKARLRWRKGSGSHRSLGWIPFKAASIRRRGRYLRFCGKTIRIFESDRFECGAKYPSRGEAASVRPRERDFAA